MNKINIGGQIWRRRKYTGIIRQQVRLLQNFIKNDKLPEFVSNDERLGNQILADRVKKYIASKVIFKCLIFDPSNCIDDVFVRRVANFFE